MHVSKIISRGDRVLIQESSIKKYKQRVLRSSKPLEYNKSVHGTKNYSDALQRAFNRVKQQVFFNSDMIYFVTFTYKGQNHTMDDVLKDLKVFFKNQKRKGLDPKYVCIAEYQKRGSIHLHLITNKLNYKKNKNGYLHAPDWPHGFSSVLSVNDFDGNFRPYLYLFKYMKKSQRIGKSFVYSSRNLNNFTELPVDEFDIKLYTLLTTENTKGFLPDGSPVYYKKYYFKEIVND